MDTDAARGTRHLSERLPTWATGVLMAVGFGGLMFLFTGRDNDVSAWQSLLIYGVAGAAFGAAMSTVLHVQRQRVFAGVDGRVTADQRIQVRRAVDHARLPADQALRPAAISLARTRLRRGQSTRAQLVLFGVFLLHSVFNAVTNGGLWWLGVAFWSVMAPWSIWVSRRQRRAARALLEHHPVAAPPS